MLLIKLPKPAAGTGNADYYFFSIMSFVFPVPSLTCDREREGFMPPSGAPADPSAACAVAS
jgi:hypothetical protein